MALFGQAEQDVLDEADERSSVNVVVTADSLVRVMDELKARGVLHAWLFGGSALAASFREQWPLIEYIVSVIPAILGSGIPLFCLPTLDPI